jgi:hypothetical protein
MFRWIVFVFDQVDFLHHSETVMKRQNYSIQPLHLIHQEDQ